MRQPHHCLCLTVIFASLAGGVALAQPDAPPAAAQDVPEPKTVIKTYNISDLMRAAGDYPLDSEIVPPTGYGNGTSDEGVGGNLFGGALINRREAADKSLLDPLSQLIVELVDTDSWRENGGTLGLIKPFSSLLVITQTEENHAKIQALLDEIRRNAGPSQIVAVRAVWLLLPATAADAPKPATVVTDEWFNKQKVYCDGRTVCFSGQTVHLTSGRGRTVVRDQTPIVGTSAVAFDPTVSQVLSGVAVQVAAQLVPGAEAAVLDVQSFASEWDEPGRGPSSSGAVATQPSGGVVVSSDIDRTNMVAQEMKTTLRVPLGKKFVVGGMTLDPAGGEKDARQLCLVVEISAVK